MVTRWQISKKSYNELSHPVQQPRSYGLGVHVVMISNLTNEALEPKVSSEHISISIPVLLVSTLNYL